MILKIIKFNRPDFLIEPNDFSYSRWNGKLEADNGWFYANLCKDSIPIDSKIGLTTTIINPDILDVFIAEENDDYENYGFFKAYGKWIKD